MASIENRSRIQVTVKNRGCWYAIKIPQIL